MIVLTRNHAELTAQVEAHIAADAVVQGNYWDGSKGCFIGCLAHSSDATVLQEKYGLPLPLVKICESIFERLPADDAKAFFGAIPAAVGCDGKDLSRVHWQFLASELRALPEVPADIQAVIDPVIDGVDRLARGEDWSASAAARDAARDAADAAARDAASAAAYAAFDAASAADAADAAASAAAYAADAAVYAARAATRDAARAAARAAAYAADAAADAAAYAAVYAASDTSVPEGARQRDTILLLISDA